jgi:sugar lactone lactonase YvrE
LISIPNIAANAKWIQNATTVAGGNGQGNELNQLNSPFGLDTDDDQTIYVADYSNHRIVEWKSGATSGTVVAGGNGQGNQVNQLNNPTAVIVDKETDSLIICDCSNKRVVRWPRRNGTSGKTIISDIASYGLTMDSDGYLYVADYSKHEVKRWKIGETEGTVVAGGNGQGNRLDQLYNPVGIFVDQDHSVYISDYSNHRVMKWMEGAKEGIVVAGGQGAGNGLTQLNHPRGVVVDQLGTVYVTEYNSHRVTRWPKGATQGSVVVGGNGGGAQPNQLHNCWGLSFYRQGNLYVADHSNHRVQKFNIDPNSIQ